MRDVAYRCPVHGEISRVDVDDDGLRICPGCGRSVDLGGVIF